MATSTNGGKVTDAIEQIATAVSSNKLSSSAAENLKRWLTERQYANYVPRILELIEHDEFERLDTMFWETIAFGTGGRRRLMAELGCATINERTIAVFVKAIADVLHVNRNARHV